MRKKRVVLFFIALLILASLVSMIASAINLEIEKKAINEVVIKELDNPASFEFTIKNLGEADNFELYSLVGVDVIPKEAFYIGKEGTKKIKVEFKTSENIKKSSGYFTFVYKIKGENTGIQEDRQTIKIITLKEAFELTADNIKTDSENATVYLQIVENFSFSNIEAEFSSVFFKFDETFSLKGFEKKSFTTSLDKEKSKTLMAGSYILDADIKVNNISEKLKSTIKFLEKSGLSVQENKEGFIIQRYEIEKRNEGNLVNLAGITTKKNIISRLFTTFNLQPDQVERKGYNIAYTWQKELRPDESLKVIVKTNWYVPIIVIIAILLIIAFVQIYLTSALILRKKINFVRTRGGEFALKVSINAKARKFVEKINLVDKLPPIVKLYERYGATIPDRIDEKNRRVEWNIESLNKGEDRTFSYIIYSKIGIVGKFELPAVRAVYERNGKIKETQSNKVFFLNEPKKIEKNY